MGMELINVRYIESVAELMENSDYSRFAWGSGVTPEIIAAAAIVAHREANGSFDPGSVEAEAEILHILNRGWVTYDTYAEVAEQDEDGDQLNTLMIRFDFNGQERDDADKRVGKVLLKEARERGEAVVAYSDADVPGTSVPGIVVFNKTTW